MPGAAQPHQPCKRRKQQAGVWHCRGSAGSRNCKQPPGSRRRAPGFPVPRGSLVHLHQAQMGCSTFKRLISFLFVFKGNIWVLRSPGTGHDGWAVCVGTAAQSFSLKQPAWSHTQAFPMPEILPGGNCPSGWTSPPLLPRASNRSQPPPASLCSRSVPYTGHAALGFHTKQGSRDFCFHPQLPKPQVLVTAPCKLPAPALRTHL